MAKNVSHKLLEKPWLQRHLQEQELSNQLQLLCSFLKTSMKCSKHLGLAQRWSYRLFV